jgi:hypothetical protein
MDRQRRLPFEEQEQLDELWLQVPEAERRKLVRLYGRLLVRAAGWKVEQSKSEEGNHEHDEQ